MAVSIKKIVSNLLIGKPYHVELDRNGRVERDKSKDLDYFSEALSAYRAGNESQVSEAAGLAAMGILEDPRAKRALEREARKRVRNGASYESTLKTFEEVGEFNLKTSLCSVFLPELDTSESWMRWEYYLDDYAKCYFAPNANWCDFGARIRYDTFTGEKIA